MAWLNWTLNPLLTCILLLSSSHGTLNWITRSGSQIASSTWNRPTVSSSAPYSHWPWHSAGTSQKAGRASRKLLRQLEGTRFGWDPAPSPFQTRLLLLLSCFSEWCFSGFEAKNDRFRQRQCRKVGVVDKNEATTRDLWRKMAIEADFKGRKWTSYVIWRFNEAIFDEKTERKRMKMKSAESSKRVERS